MAFLVPGDGAGRSCLRGVRDVSTYLICHCLGVADVPCRVAWEGRDSVIRLQETVPLAASKRAGGAPEHRPRNVVTINNDTGR
jgi:hypothetical protein